MKILQSLITNLPPELRLTVFYILVTLLWVESQERVGSEFIIELPRNQPEWSS